MFLLSSPAAALFCFCSHSKTPARIISKYLQYAYWPRGICLVFFWRVSVSSTESKIAAKIKRFRHGKELDDHLKQAPDSKKLHCVFNTGIGKVYVRETSCFCSNCWVNGNFNTESSCNGWLFEKVTNASVHEFRNTEMIVSPQSGHNPLSAMNYKEQDQCTFLRQQHHPAYPTLNS